MTTAGVCGERPACDIRLSLLPRQAGKGEPETTRILSQRETSTYSSAWRIRLRKHPARERRMDASVGTGPPPQLLEKKKVTNKDNFWETEKKKQAPPFSKKTWRAPGEEGPSLLPPPSSPKARRNASLTAETRKEQRSNEQRPAAEDKRTATCKPPAGTRVRDACQRRKDGKKNNPPPTQLKARTPTAAPSTTAAPARKGTPPNPKRRGTGRGVNTALKKDVGEKSQALLLPTFSISAAPTLWTKKSAPPPHLKDRTREPKKKEIRKPDQLRNPA